MATVGAGDVVADADGAGVPDAEEGEEAEDVEDVEDAVGDVDDATFGSEHPATATSTAAAPDRARSLETDDTALPNPFRTSTADNVAFHDRGS
jgi:hypothetical protein